jgi:hypothetical protein
MKFKINHKLSEDKGIVYVLQLNLEDKQLIKIGITTRKIEERVVEILTAIWKKYRVFPECHVARYCAIDSYLAMEKYLHEHYKEFKYDCEHKWSGNTEIFLLDIEEVKNKYDEIKNDFCNKNKCITKR